MTAAILLGMEAARLSSSCTWMLDQVLVISPFNSTRLVGRLLLMHLFIIFHTSSIMFRSGLLAGQSSIAFEISLAITSEQPDGGVKHDSLFWGSTAPTLVVSWMLHSCSDFLDLFQDMQEPDLAEKSCLHRHTDAIQILYGWTKVNSLTLPYTQYGVYVTVDLRKTILPIPLVDTQPHTITEVGNFTDLFKQAGL